MKLLFFCHLCDRTGAELVLYHLIRNADRTAIKMAVACGARGELSQTFPRDVRVFNYWKALSLADQALKNDSRALWLTNGIFNVLIRQIHERVRPDAWYINTIVQPKILALARELRVPCVLHTHEQEHMLSRLKASEVEDMIKYPRLVIAASQGAANILGTLGRRENIEVCHESIDISAIKTDQQRSTAIRQVLRIPPKAFVWAMSGTRDPNKNPVGFVRIADELVKRAPETYFLWIGGADSGHSLYAKALAEKLRVDDKISWVLERREDYFDYLNVADGFVLTSLHETLPLVVIEAAALGKPFVSFNSGGPAEIFREGMGVIVDSWNVEDMVKAMLQVMRGEIYVDADISKARARQFDVSVIVKQWERIIQQYISNTPARESSRG